MAVLPTGIGPVTGYNIERSLRFNSADSAYLNRTPASAGNRKTWTWSAWVKRSALGASEYLFSAGTGGTDTTQQGLNFQTDSTLRWVGAGTVYLVTTQVFRDSSAWYHVVFVFDTTQATANDRQKIYINGTQITAFTTQTNPTQNLDYAVNQAAAFNIGRWTGASNYFNGYITEVNFIDGQALTPSSFGETDSNTGVWKPKAYSGTYGTNGFFLKFADNSGTTSTTLGKDSSGNGNNWTPNLFSVTAGAGNDSLVDSPTSYGTDTGIGGEVRGNYCTWNPLDNSLTLANGNLDTSRATASWASCRATVGMTSGKWYWEISGTGTYNSSNGPMIGISKASASLSTYPGGDANGWGYYSATGTKYTSATSSSYGSTWTGTDVIGVAFDADNGTLTFYKNNTNQGTAFTGLTSGPYFPAMGIYGTATVYCNFGQRAFAYTAPSGFKALCTQNLPTPTIGATSTTQANDYFDVTLYTGTGATLSVTNSGSMQPDFVWLKRRSASSSHALVDSVRGVDKYLYSDVTNAEGTVSPNDALTSLNSNGFTLGANVNSGAPFINNSGGTFVAWQWNAGGSNATNTSGTITSTVRANTTSGCSIVTYTGTGANATVGHGLGATPAMIIVKNRNSGAIGGAVYHTSMGATKYLKLFQTTTGNDGEATDNTAWNGSSPTFNTNVFSVGSLNRTNSSQQMVAYCFAAVAGYSAFGSYIGNGAADGPFVYTGFRPRYVMIKASSSTGSWNIIDTARNPSNLVTQGLYADLVDAEDSTRAFDILSNGFKMRSATVANANTGTHIYMAFAESPFKYALAR